MSHDNRAVEIHFIDGPLQGTRKMEDVSKLHRLPTYRVLESTNFHSEVNLPNRTDNEWKQVTCIEWHYVPFPIPRSYNGAERYVMLLAKGLN